jgi:hypothetical protein
MANASPSTGDLGAAELAPLGSPLFAQSYLYPVIATGVLIAAWELLTRYGNVSPLILPSPSAILATTVANFPVLMQMSVVTVYEFVLGFGLAILIGLPLGALIVYARPFEVTFYPLLVAFQTIPKAAIAPVFIVWLGTGATSKILIAFAISFFPIVVDTIIGLRSSQPETIYLAIDRCEPIPGVPVRPLPQRTPGNFWRPEGGEHARCHWCDRRRVRQLRQRTWLFAARGERRTQHGSFLPACWC